MIQYYSIYVYVADVRHPYKRLTPLLSGAINRREGIYEPNVDHDVAHAINGPARPSKD